MRLTQEDLLTRAIADETLAEMEIDGYITVRRVTQAINTLARVIRRETIAYHKRALKAARSRVER